MLLDEIARRVIYPENIVTTGWPSVKGTCQELGITFDDWQDDLGRIALGKNALGLYCSDTTAISIPRQAGKTYWLAGIAFGLCIRNPTKVMWTAHRSRTAAETFRSMQAMAQMPLVAPHIANVSRGAGKEAIEFTNGSRILFGARERGFGRGFAGIDVLIFDEAQILSENAMDDMVPTTNTAPNPLIILAGTPPKPSDPAQVFTGLRQSAIDGDLSNVVYVEMSAERGSDPLDRNQWRRANPSYPQRTSENAILRLHKTLSEDSFCREALGIWDEFSRHQPVVSSSVWDDLADYAIDGVRPTALGVDMSHSREISIAACWLDDQRAHVEEVWAGPSTLAAINFITSRSTRRMPVVIDGVSPAAALIPELNSHRVKVVQTGAQDMAKACGQFFDRITSRTLTHGAQDSITEALAGARTRPIRDAGGWGWDRRDESITLAPLVAATLALYGASTTPRSGRGRDAPSSREVLTL